MCFHLEASRAWRQAGIWYHGGQEMGCPGIQKGQKGWCWNVHLTHRHGSGENEKSYIMVSKPTEPWAAAEEGRKGRWTW